MLTCGVWPTTMNVKSRQVNGDFVREYIRDYLKSRREEIVITMMHCDMCYDVYIYSLIQTLCLREAQL